MRGIMHAQTVSIIIPAKNEAQNLPKVLSALHQAINGYSGPCEIILVDNGSSDATQEIASSFGCTVHEDKSASIARLRNIGVEKSSGNIIAFLDADCLVDHRWISSCVTKLADEKIGLVGTRAIPDFDAATWVENGWYRLISGVERSDYPNWIGSSNMFIRRDVLIAAGGFDEHLTTAEDVNLCHKIRQNHRICLNKAVDTIHLRESKTLADLMKRELWRGKGSIRQFLESSCKRDDALSVIVPTMHISCSCAAMALLPFNQAFAALFFTPILLLPVGMMLKKKAMITTVQEFTQVYIVAFVYLFSRALAVVAELFTILSAAAGGRKICLHRP